MPFSMKYGSIKAGNRSKRTLSASDQAAAWLATLSDESATLEERRDFAQWLKRSNSHVEEFLAISTLTRQLQSSTDWPEENIDELLNQARMETNITPLLHPSSLRNFEDILRPHRRPKLLWAAAASLVLLTAALMLQLPTWLRDRDAYATTLGELRSVTLDDGSIVQMNAQSSIRTHYTPAERRVELVSGEAMFQVAKNAARPFKVTTHFTDIVAVGTQFNVNAQTNKTIVTVLEGSVRIAPLLEQEREGPVYGRVRNPEQHGPTQREGEVFLTAGQQAVIQRERAVQKIARVDPIKVTGWTARRLYFEDTPLADAAHEFSRYSTQSVRIDDPTLAQRRITGTFDSSDPAALVQFLARYADTTVTESDNGWIVGRSDQKPAAH